MRKRAKITLVVTLGLIALLSLILTPSVYSLQVEGSVSNKNSAPITNISVDQAYHLTKHSPNLVILDVRNQSEYDEGHLYGAILIPVYQLEARISELESYVNDSVLVYCKSGFRSTLACPILEDHNFTTIYNMIGGIDAWMQAGYPIDTSYHYVSVDVENNDTAYQIEPWLLHIANCSTCQNQQCSQNTQTPINVTQTYLENSATHQVIQINDTVNGSTLYEVDKTLLWSYNESKDGVNRTITLVSSTISNQTVSTQLFGLYDYVYAGSYNLTVGTIIAPLDSETYNWSSTIITYIPAGGEEITSQERIDFNSSVTLSQLYDSLGQVVHKLGKLYDKSEDSNLTQFASRYYTIAQEAKLISRKITINLPDYNKNILESNATIVDDNPLWSLCSYFCAGGFLAVCGLAAYFSMGALAEFCIAYADEIAVFSDFGGCDLFCAYLEGISTPNAPQPSFWASSVAWHGTISGNGGASYWNNIVGPGCDGNYAEIYGGNYGDAAAIGAQMNAEASGEIYLYGYSYSGYYSHIYVYVTDDQQHYTEINSFYVNSNSPQTIDVGQYSGNFKYIYIAGYDDQGLSCRIEIDAIAVVPSGGSSSYYLTVYGGDSMYYYYVSALVYIDGQCYGTTDNSFQLSAGTHTIQLEDPGYSYFGYCYLPWLYDVDNSGNYYFYNPATFTLNSDKTIYAVYNAYG